MGIPRQLEVQATHYLRREIAYNTANVGNGVLIGTVPAGARLMHVRVWIDTAFNAGTNNNLTGGTTGTGTNLFTSGDAAAGTVGVKTPAAAAGQGIGLVITQDQDLFVAFSQTGTAATAGVASVVVEFIPLSNGG